MKTLIAIILTALLAACGDCPPEVAPLPPNEVVTAIPAPVVEPEPIVTAPIYCTEKLLTNCVAKVPAPCLPDDPSCQILFCQPVGYCPIEKPAPPALPVFCTDKITTNCEVQFCPQSSAGCPPSPTPAPRIPEPVIEVPPIIGYPVTTPPAP